MDLSVVILTWNTKAYLDKLLKSMNEYRNNCKYEIIVIDNGSEDDTYEYIKKKYPQVILFRNNINLGTSQRNIGMNVSRGRYIAFLDSDIELIEDYTFDRLIEYMDINPQVGLISPQLIMDNGEIQLSCKKFLKFYTPILRRLDFIPFIRNTKLYRDQLLADWDHNDIREVDYTVSAFWCFRKDLIKTVGLLDEKIFYAPEDVDYCLRIWKKGYRIVYFPNVKVKHHYQRMTRTIFSRITYEHIKGLIYYFWKHKYLIKPSL
ncbi:MAG: glycosyltransferase family 2 protein [Ignavibacteria bacterium]|nr:glycosyltransferase family 2 protein [Ignavibacteria bacterium]